MYKIMTDDLVYSFHNTEEEAKNEMEILKTLTWNEITEAKNLITENEEFLKGLSLVNGSLVDKDYRSHYKYIPKVSNLK
tara:strand:- start:494 stop:730 length:237 start_codon:yes stop_codon:yes gene_type:complete